MTKSISEKILQFRKLKGLTQEKLGELCGVSGQAVSKWEKAESLPDIMLLPTLCEVLDITADALLEVPASVKKKNCMVDLFSYARDAGEYQAAFEAICATSYLSDQDNGGAKMSSNGVKIHNTKGLGLVISSREMMQKIKETDISSIKEMADLITNENVMSVIRVLDFSTSLTESEIATQTGLSDMTVESTLFKLLKFMICECNADGRYTFGAKSYILFAILAGFYLSSPEGFNDIGNLTCSYTQSDN